MTLLICWRKVKQIRIDNICEQILRYFLKSHRHILSFRCLYTSNSFLDAVERCFIFVYCRLEDNKTKTVNSFLPEQKKKTHMCRQVQIQLSNKHRSIFHLVRGREEKIDQHTIQGQKSQTSPVFKIEKNMANYPKLLRLVREILVVFLKV